MPRNKGIDFEVNAKKYLYNYGGYQANTAAHSYHFHTENLREVGIFVIRLSGFPDFKLFYLQHMESFSSNHTRSFFLLVSGQNTYIIFFQRFSCNENAFAQP